MLLEKNDTVCDPLEKRVRFNIQPTKTLVICASYGGFTLSDEAIMLVNRRGGTLLRDDPVLIKTVKDLGIFANGDVYGFQMDIRAITFNFDPQTEHFDIYHYNGYEAIIVVNKSTKIEYVIETNGSRTKVTV